MPTLLARLFRRKRIFARQAVRHPCRIDGELLLLDSGVSYVGQLQNLSSGGAMFRPRLAYLLYRRDTPARLRLGAISIEGRIVSTTPAGFGLSFAGTLDAGMVEHVLKTGAA